MENYYEFLKIDMTASLDDISSAAEAMSSLENADQAKIREVKSILLNETAKKIYDEKLINSILNKGKTSHSLQLAGAKDIFNIDNSMLHDKYIWIATALFVSGIISGLIFSLTVNYTINFLVMIAILILFYMDWKLLKAHGKATFSKWWMLFSPVYIAKRCKALGEGKKLLAVWLAIWAFCAAGNFIFNSGTALLEQSACGVVTDIYRNQLHQYSKTCKNVTITQSQGKEHYGFAELNDGSTRDISVNETPNGQIYVRLD
ncbi:hypothetical protein MUU49_06185 [Scandinavium goeteborgense]|uniref:hypothetical protein n=1 Tax=Scandinavium goeteborgense TaxID=1851514 RepID=UPI002165979F|nr:hypothetical protein [Scandinavium goeteborgense]MCS2152172.1 hypothetical protein [Scandinavium goeteborgense]